MNDRQKENQERFLRKEARILKQLEKEYRRAQAQCREKIAELAARLDVEADNGLSVVYQMNYQRVMDAQLDAIIQALHSGQFETVADYLQEVYYDSFTGVMYDLAGQGIPVIIPIPQNQVVKAVQVQSKLSKPLYESMGEDVTKLKRDIKATLSSGIASGQSWGDMANALTNSFSSPFSAAMKRTMLIVRTEGHRVQQSAAFDAQMGARESGADVVKQWDSTMDDRTRPTHRQLDGQIREIEDDFEINGYKAKYPGAFGVPAEDCNCRCVTNQRAKWALDEDELKALKDRAAYFGLDKSKDIEEFTQKYMVATRGGEEPTGPPIAGVMPGKPMDHAKANTYKVNPGINAKSGFLKRGYEINCQTCAAVYEARRRGYKVQALPNDGTNQTIEQLAYNPAMAYKEAVIVHPPGYDIGVAGVHELEKGQSMTPKRYTKWLDDTVKEGERYCIWFTWKGGQTGHIVNLGRDEDGNIWLHDEQRETGEKKDWRGLEEVEGYLSRTKFSGTFRGYRYKCVPSLLRTDNLEMDYDICGEIMEQEH